MTPPRSLPHFNIWQCEWLSIFENWNFPPSSWRFTLHLPCRRYTVYPGVEFSLREGLCELEEGRNSRFWGCSAQAGGLLLLWTRYCSSLSIMNPPHYIICNISIPLPLSPSLLGIFSLPLSVLSLYLISPSPSSHPSYPSTLPLFPHMSLSLFRYGGRS